MAAHRYWRVRNVQANGNPVACAELELRTAISGSNVATGGTYIQSSEYSSGYNGHFAFDGVGAYDGSEWAASSNGNEWIGYDFGVGNAEDIVEIAYTARQYYGSQTPYFAVLEYSDDASAWSIAFPLAFGSFSNGETKVKQAGAVPAAGANPHLYWRIQFTSYTGGICAGKEAELHLTPGAGDAVDLYSVYISDNGHYSDWIAARLFDGDNGTYWAGNDSIFAQFFSPTTVEEFTWAIRPDGGDNYQAPIAGKVYWSDDASAWTEAWDFTFASPFLNSVPQTVTNPDAGAPPAPRRRAAIIIC